MNWNKIFNIANIFNWNDVVDKDDWTIIEIKPGKAIVKRAKPQGRYSLVFFGDTEDCWLYVAEQAPVALGAINFVEAPSSDWHL